MSSSTFEPVLTTRIPLEESKRHVVWYDEYIRTGGCEALNKAIKMSPAMGLV